MAETRTCRRRPCQHGRPPQQITPTPSAHPALHHLQGWLAPAADQICSPSSTHSLPDTLPITVATTTHRHGDPWARHEAPSHLLQEHAPELPAGQSLQEVVVRVLTHDLHRLDAPRDERLLRPRQLKVRRRGLAGGAAQREGALLQHVAVRLHQLHRHRRLAGALHHVRCLEPPGLGHVGGHRCRALLTIAALHQHPHLQRAAHRVLVHVHRWQQSARAMTTRCACATTLPGEETAHQALVFKP